MIDLVLRNARLRGGEVVDIAADGGIIRKVGPSLEEREIGRASCRARV